MAFPGTYNFSYYRGDRFEFNIYPKSSDGSEFSLDGYTALFTLSTARGAAGVEGQISATAVIEGNTLKCSIDPETGITFDPSISYVYDVEISKTVTEPEAVTFTYTLLTGSISVTDHITGATA
jgi:hypothetical protein